MRVPERARAPNRAASVQAPPALDRGASASELVLQAPRVAVAALRGKFSPLENAHEMAHFLRMAFIGASSAAAAFFFLMARRLMPFIAFAFFPPFRIAFRMALRIAFAMSAEGGGTRVAVCRALLFAGLDA